MLDLINSAERKDHCKKQKSRFIGKSLTRKIEKLRVLDKTSATGITNPYEALQMRKECGN